MICYSLYIDVLYFIYFIYFIFYMFYIDEFNNMNDSESFKILHSNLNGVENIFDDYHTFVTSANSNFDVMCISETTQKENFPFNLNINIDGYGQPFTLGSKTARGGVAIYVKDEYNVIERNDLNIVDNSLEAVWVEIKNEKGKNIVCGCIYRHPNSDIDDFNKYISKCLTIINTEKKECYVSAMSRITEHSSTIIDNIYMEIILPKKL